MRYQGSKARIAKEIIPIISKDLKKGKTFVDLFGGGMNLVDKVDWKDKIACDINKYVIALWKDIQSNGMLNVPKGVTQEMYIAAKQSYINNDGKFTDAEIGFIATACSYGGGWFNGYAHYNPNKNEDHIAEAWNGLKKQVDNFKHLDSTKFYCFDYQEIEENMDMWDAVIYADPPYAATKSYESDFDNIAFWEWVRWMHRKQHTIVYISEYDAPEDFECVWQKSVPDGMGTTKNGIKQARKVEKLFKYKG